MERWGPDDRGALYLSVYNASEQEVTTCLTIDTNSLGLADDLPNAEDLLSRDRWKTEPDGRDIVVELPMPPQPSRVLKFVGTQ